MATRLRMGETAQRLGLSQDTVREWVRRGFLKARRTPTGQLLFDEVDVETARTGNSSLSAHESGTQHASADKDETIRTSPWQKLPPWVTKVEAARACLTLDTIEAERKQRLHEREVEAQRAIAAQQRESQEKAQRQRLNGIKKRVLQTVWIPAEYNSEVIAEIERFATPEQLPAWLAESEQLDLVAGHARSLVNKYLADDQERLAASCAKEVQRLNTEREQLSRELFGQIADASEPGDLQGAETPRSVAEALRLRGVTDP